VRIGLHVVLMFLCAAAGLWAFGFGTGLLLAWLDWMTAWPLVLIAAGIGRALGHAAGKRISARCPACGGRAYNEVGARIGAHFPIRYRCSACGDVHLTGISEGR
jgi:DNA-directed RNA polymerase subunit RPC12/RpoP